MFEEYDFDSIEDEMLSNVNDELDKREGSVIYDATAPAALALANFYVALDMVMNEVYADTASYYYLCKRAAERNMYPYEETSAICKMKVSPEDVEISAGDRFNLDELNYTVVGPVYGENGAYQIECETKGIIGNQQLGTLLPIEDIAGLETAELTGVIIPGEDEEDVESFRERYFESFRDKAFGGNKSDYKKEVNAIDGVGDCKVLRRWRNGFNPQKFIPNDTVTDWFNSLTVETVGEDVYNWLIDVYTAAKDKLLTVGGTVKVIFIGSDYNAPSSELIEKVQNALDPVAGEGDGIAPIGHVVSVVGVKESLINYEFGITYVDGYSFESLKTQIEEALDGYHLQLRKSWADDESTIVRKGYVETLLLAITGIKDVTSVKINGQEQNLDLAEDEIPARGDING